MNEVAPVTVTLDLWLVGRLVGWLGFVLLGVCCFVLFFEAEENLGSKLADRQGMVLTECGVFPQAQVFHA